MCIRDRAEEAQRQGNWADYGKHLNQLQNILKSLEKFAGVDNQEEIEQMLEENLPEE